MTLTHYWRRNFGASQRINDGVRFNTRLFMTAGVLRKNPNIKWTKDRGNEPMRDKDQFSWFWNGGRCTGDRVNDIHLTSAVKIESCKAKGAKS